MSAYLLGILNFDALLALQRRLVYDVSGDHSASIILCDHGLGITVGREGSSRDVRPNPDELHRRGWSVQWVSRGGGTMLHLPGQVACYPVFPLDVLGFTPARYVEELQAVVVDLCREYGLAGHPDAEHPGVRVNGRRVAHVGVAVRHGITCFGLIVNADPDLEPFRDVKCAGDSLPMTSLARESSMRVRVSGVRQKLLELTATRFGFDRLSVFHTLPGVLPRPSHHARAHRP